MRTHAVLTRESPTTRTPGWNLRVGGKGDAARHSAASPTGPPGKHGNAPVFPSTPSWSAVAAFAPAWAAPGAPPLDGKSTRIVDLGGKLADMAVPSDDLFTMDPSSIDKVRALRTIVGGKVVHEARQ